MGVNELDYDFSDIEEALKDRQPAADEGRCIKAPIGCGKIVTEASFRDSISLKEYGISKLCQECQDSVFNEPDEDYDGYFDDDCDVPPDDYLDD